MPESGAPARVKFELDDLRKYFTPEDPEPCRAFVERFLKFLEGTPYDNHARLHEELSKHPLELSDTTRSSASTWQRIFNPLHKKRTTREAVEMILDLLPVLFPEVAGDGIAVFADAAVFNNRFGTAKHIPEGFRRPIQELFATWLQGGADFEQKRQLAHAPSVEGLYDVYFPWLEFGKWEGRVAHALARITRETDRVAFESYANSDSHHPVLYTGCLRFTGDESAVLVAFTSGLWGRHVHQPAAAASEMLVHPYRIPKSLHDWWHGTTTFLGRETHDYTATVPHVMKRRSVDLCSASSVSIWRKEMTRSTRLLSAAHGEYASIVKELRRCPLAPIFDRDDPSNA